MLDHSLLSGTLFHNAVADVYVLHEIDNTSDYDPVALRLGVQVKYVQCAERVHAPRMSWLKACSLDIESCCSSQCLCNIAVQYYCS